MGGDYDLRKLTPQQKGAITRQFERYSSIVNHPDQFKILTVKRETAKQITVAAKKIPIKNGKSKLIIPIEKGQTVKIKNNRAVFSGGQFEEEVYKGGWDFFDSAKEVFSKKLKNNEAVTVRIGDHRMFSRKFTDLQSLLNYMGGWLPDNWGKLGESKKDLAARRRLKNELITHISITRVKFNKAKKGK